MGLVTLTQAAKMVGKSKPTLWRAHKDGRLSMSRDEHGNWQVDPAELLRTYGKFAVSEQETQHFNSSFKQTTVDLIGLERENDSLKRHISTLEESLRRSDETLSDIRTRLDVSEQERREAQRLLTHQTAATEKAPSTSKWLIGIGITVILVLTGLGLYMIRTNANAI